MTSGLARSSIAICVPVRDEAAALPHLFEAVEALVLPAGGTLTLCLLLDGCRDDSARVAERYRSVARPRVHLAEVDRGMPNAGLARRRAMAMAGGADIILTTDADSRPAPDWVEAMLAGLARADVVAGRVVREGGVASLLQDRVERYYDALFALRRMLDPVCWEAPVTHHHASGANLGVRGCVYRTLGGFMPLASGEDARFVDDAGRGGWRVRRDAGAVVRTSARRDGRAEGGLAHMLRALDRGSGVEVAHPADASWQYRMQAAARGAFRDGTIDARTVPIGLTTDHLIGVARDCPNAEAFAMRVVPVPPGGMRPVTLALAEVELAKLSDAQAVAA